MGPVNWLGVIGATLGFFAVGAVWYGMLLGKIWQREVAPLDPPQGAAMLRIMGLTLLAEFVICAMLGHLYARTLPPDHVKMMMAGGFALAVMAPAIGINYLHQRRSLRLFLIDAGHLLVGMLVAGAIFVALG